MELTQPFRNSPYSFVDVPQNPVFSFTVTPLSASQPQWCNIFRIQKIDSTEDKCFNGCRVPLVGFGSGSNPRLHIRVDNALDYDIGFENEDHPNITLPVGYPTLVTLTIDNQANMNVYFNNTWKAWEWVRETPSYGPGLLWRSDSFTPACNVTLGPISITTLDDGPVALLNSSKYIKNVTITENPLVTFAIRLNAVNTADYCSVFRVTRSNNHCCNAQDRVFMGYISPGRRELELWVDTSNTTSWAYKVFNFGNLTLGQTYDIAFSVSGNTTFLFVDGVLVKKTISFGGSNGQPQKGNFEFWQADKHHPACNAAVSAITFSTTPASGILNLKPNPPDTGVDKPLSNPLVAVSRNKFVGKFALSPIMTANFNITLNSINTASDCSLLRLTTTNYDVGHPGDRILYVYVVKNSTNLTMWMDLSYTNSQDYIEFFISNLTLSESNNVTVQVAGNDLEVFINGTSHYFSDNIFDFYRRPLSGYVSYYQADNFRPACNATMTPASFGETIYGTIPENNTVIDFVTVPPNATYSFGIYPLSESQPAYCKIFRIQHVGTSGRDCNQGCTIPYVGFNWQGTTQLWIRMDTEYYHSYGTNGNEHPLLEIPPYQWSNIVVSVQGQFVSIFINNIFVYRFQVNGRISTGVAGVWVSDPYNKTLCNVMVSNITVSAASDAPPDPTFKPYAQNPIRTEVWSSTNTNFTSTGGADITIGSVPGRFGLTLSPQNKSGIKHKVFSQTGLVCAGFHVPVVNGTDLQFFATSNFGVENGTEVSGWDEFSFDFVSSISDGVSINNGINGSVNLFNAFLSANGSNWSNYNEYCLYWDLNPLRAGSALWFYNGQLIKGEGGYYGVNDTTKLQPIINYWHGGLDFPDEMGEYNDTTSTVWVSNLTYTYW